SAISARLMLTSATAIGAGLWITALLGLLSKDFLNCSVWVKFPPGFEFFEKTESGGGGKQLGVLERVLFFGSLWIGRYEVVAGWLAFKVAAKWASWQHITRMPETIFPSDVAKDMEIKRVVSARVLGRFLNGTLFNILCAAIGWVVSNFVFRTADWLLPGNSLWWAFAGTWIGALEFLIWSGWPDPPTKDAAVSQ